MKHTLCIFTVSMLLLASVSALADHAPESQFGFSGWPYRQQNPACTQENEANPSPSPVHTPVIQATLTPTAQPSQQPAATATPRPQNTPTASTGDYTTISLSAQEQKAWNLLNNDRTAHGLPVLSLDKELSRIARIKSCDMKENRYFAHESPTYGNASAMLTHFGYSFSGVGENIAHHATVEKSQAAFMSSQGHRANILGSQWTKVGIGVCYDDQGFVYVTQLFAR